MSLADKRKQMIGKRMITKNLKFLLGIGLASCLPYVASGNLIVNGYFADGNAGFDSDYISNPNNGIGGAPNAPLPTTGGGDGAYSIVTDPYGPNPVQNPWGGVSYGAVPPSEYMMAVNGAENPLERAWYENVSGMTIGTTYEFSYYLSNWSFDPVAQIQTTIGGVSQGSVFAPETAGIWVMESLLWKATSTSAQFAMYDLQTAANGNDFALDNISMTAVPEPTTIISAALMLLPFGASTLRILRRRVA